MLSAYKSTSYSLTYWLTAFAVDNCCFRHLLSPILALSPLANLARLSGSVIGSPPTITRRGIVNRDACVSSVQRNCQISRLSCCSAAACNKKAALSQLRKPRDAACFCLHPMTFRLLLCYKLHSPQKADTNVKL